MNGHIVRYRNPMASALPGGAAFVRLAAMTPLTIYTDPAFLGHDTGAGHPERADRLRAIERADRKSVV